MNVFDIEEILLSIYENSVQSGKVVLSSLCKKYYALVRQYHKHCKTIFMCTFNKKYGDNIYCDYNNLYLCNYNDGQITHIHKSFAKIIRKECNLPRDLYQYTNGNTSNVITMTGNVITMTGKMIKKLQFVPEYKEICIYQTKNYVSLYYFDNIVVMVANRILSYYILEDDELIYVNCINIERQHEICGNRKFICYSICCGNYWENKIISTRSNNILHEFITYNNVINIIDNYIFIEDDQEILHANIVNESLMFESIYKIPNNYFVSSTILKLTLPFITFTLTHRYYDNEDVDDSVELTTAINTEKTNQAPACIIVILNMQGEVVKSIHIHHDYIANFYVIGNTIFIHTQLKNTIIGYNVDNL